MRTNIVLNDKLVKEAFRYSDAKTKRELIHLALEEFVRNHKKRDLRELKGQIHFEEDYDYKAARKGK